jgi:uncharacterized protein (TIGR03435 family)
MRLSWIIVGLLAIGFALHSASQDRGAGSSGATPNIYEVVSIKPSKPGTPGSSEIMPNGFRETDATLDSLVRDAFHIVYDKLVVGLPSWTESEPYDIEAKVDADTADRWRKLTSTERRKEEQPMLQALLIDRCKLKFHFEKKELPVYDLVIDKDGLKMKEAPQGEVETEELAAGVTLTAHAIAMEGLIYTLSGTDGRLVVDKTGLGGKRFDFRLHWTPSHGPALGDSGPSLFTALEEQLGLKLVPSKDAVNVLVIDQMERPSAN